METLKNFFQDCFNDLKAGKDFVLEQNKEKHHHTKALWLTYSENCFYLKTHFCNKNEDHGPEECAPKEESTTEYKCSWQESFHLIRKKSRSLLPDNNEKTEEQFAEIVRDARMKFKEMFSN